MVYHTRLEVADGDQTRHGDTAALGNQRRPLGCHKTTESCNFGGEVIDKTGA